ncbi:magnesium chelatase [Archaeoglobales archaeon]|nr:MAG: magnesium chelatase [Archaeoglobales archaeon]
MKSIGKSGRYVDFRLSGEEIAIGATVRTALSRGVRIPEERDYRYKICSSRSASSIAVLVDASSSMASLRRMELAKGLIFRLLQDAYIRKDRVSMIVFKNNSAEVVVPPTSSPQLAAKRLAELTTGGKTPLAAGLLKARDLLRIETRKGYVPILVLITDGRANVSISGDIKREIERISEAIARDKILTVVFDADDFVSLGYAREISEITGGLYYRLKELSEEKIFGVVDEIRRSFSF